MSTFWITNPDSIIRDNVAAGSEQIGFWLAFPEHPTGQFEGTKISASTWVIFELPAFSTASTGTEQRSRAALRKASSTSHYSDDDTLWVKLVAPDTGGGDGGFPGFGGGTGIQVSK